MGIDTEEQVMGRVLYLPVASAAGESAALRDGVLDGLLQRRVSLVDGMAVAVRRSGQGPLLEVGGVALERRLDGGVGMALAAWAERRPLRAEELDALRRVGTAVARSGIPLWRVLAAVQVAARAGWEQVAEHALAVVEGSRHPRQAARLVGELSVEAVELIGRIQAEIAAGHGEATQAAQRRAGGHPARA